MKMPSIFSDNMVLQSGTRLKIWGWDHPGQEVTVELFNEKGLTTTDNAGNWQVELPPMSAGKTGEMKVTGSEEIIVRNIIIGEVWVCSGQSNMEWVVDRVDNAEEEIKQADYPGIRLFRVPHVAELEIVKNVDAQWEICSPETIINFSAVAYFFGRSINRNQKLPVGLISTSWGGTCAETWTSRESLMTVDHFRELVTDYEKSLENHADAYQKYERELKEWEEQNIHKDPGNSRYGQGWASPDCNTSDWQSISVPGSWQSKGMNYSGVIWFRKKIEIPESWAGKDCILSLGPCDKSDTTYFNNERVGGLDIDEDPNAWSTPRIYKIPAKLIRAGENTIAVRIYSNIYAGGFICNSGTMNLSLESAPEHIIPLAGDDWLCKTEHNFGLIPTGTNPQPPFGPGNANSPHILFDNMITPLIPFAIKGAIWYQGESNARRSKQYKELFSLMINDWRKHWQQGDFPFYFVQLANYFAGMDEGIKSPWAEIREAQLKTLKLPNTGMAVTIDIGIHGDIHPTNKQDVGERLALIARNQLYNEDIEYSGPFYERHEMLENGDIRIHFSHGLGLKTIPVGELTEFTVIKDNSENNCQAVIEDNSVIVKCSHISDPEEIRYGWSESPNCNFYNRDGLPASPFRIILP